MSSPAPTPLLQAPGKPFEDLCRDLGGDPRAWRETEDLESVSAPEGFQCTVQTASQAIPSILRCIQSYGGALEGSLEVPGIPDGSLALTAGLQSTRLTDFLGRFKSGITLDLALKIHKPTLLQQELDPRTLAGLSEVRTVLFFFRQTLENLFSNPTEMLEATGLWLPGPARKVVLLAPEWSGSLDGPYLAILGDDPPASLSRVTRSAAARRNPFAVTPEQVYQEGRENLRWETGSDWPRLLTPLHLLVDGDAPKGDPVAEALLLHRTNLCLLFSADRTLRTASGLRAVYSGGQRQARVAFAPPQGGPLTEKQSEGVEILEFLVGWAYMDKLTVDRLSFLQVEIAGALRSLPDSAVDFTELLTRARRIREDLDIRWGVFIEGKIDAFTAEARALEDDVANTAQAFSEQTSAMIRNLSENMLAAVAVILGTFIASLFDQKTDPEVLRIGLLLYLLYLLLFPLGFGMVERWRSFQVLCRHFEERRRRFAQVISKKKVDTIVDAPLERSIGRFRYWFRLTLATYLIVAAALWLAIPPPFPSNPFHPQEAPELPEVNEDLREARVFAQGDVLGAEDVAVDRAGRLYTGTADGRIARVILRPDNQADVLTFARTGGRPFGLRFDPAGNLIVAVAQKGLVSIDPTGKVTVLVSKVHGIPLGFVNTLDIARDGKIYFSESAPGYSPTRHLDELLESRPRGRLLVYDPKAPGEKVTILLENLFFANGVALTTDQRAVLVAETYAYRIRRYWLDGPNRGTWDTFADNLPGFPDNLTSDRNGRYWLALFTVRKALLDSIHPHPFLKKQLIKLPRALWPKPAAYGLVVALDETGKIVRSLHDPGGRTVRGVTTARPAGNRLYLGTFDGEWLASVPLEP